VFLFFLLVVIVGGAGRRNNKPMTDPKDWGKMEAIKQEMVGKEKLKIIC
jgi:hypothetical protein